ncbi:MAG: O-antigen ligase family protein [Ruminococcus flavefaciens]|nr:O-antigen ligase family protein [Ruminococcus flavefaciens]MCM1228971.1 O-antigen ligase family protein [Ruminococcus flavefaciens]
MAKQLFNSSENSNFILNLTEEKYSKLASFGLLTACFSTSLLTAIPVIARQQMYALSAVGLAVAGVICMILALIGAIKKYIGKKTLVPVCAFGFMLIWGVISLINSYDVNIAFYGYTGRGEGLLAIIFYACFFCTALSVKREKSVLTLIYGIVGAGLLNSIFALIQVFTGKLSNYRMLSMELQANAASGLAQSPLFLAMLLTLSLTASLMGFLFLEKKSGRIFCIISACIFSFTMMFTYSLIGICGVVFAVISVIIAVFAMKSPKIRLLSVLAVIIPAVLSVILVQCGLIGNITQYRLYDGRILWFADSYYRISASGNFNSDVLDIDSTGDVYYYLNRRTMNIIESNALTGTGPEQLVFPQLYTFGTSGEEGAISDIVADNKGTFDKVYNEYLYTTATRGVPSGIALVVILVSVLAIGFMRFRKTGKWQSLCMLILTAGGVLLFLIGCSNICYSAVFWCVAGMCCADTKEK